MTDKLLKVHVDKTRFPDLTDNPIADDKYYQSGQVNGIIGTEIFKNDRIMGSSGSPAMVQTEFVYVVMDSMPTLNSNNHLTILIQDDFW